MERKDICCPYCGSTMQVPEDAENVVCTFCAKTIDLRPAKEQSEEDLGFPEALEPLIAPELFTERVDMKKFNKVGYPVQYENYLHIFRPALDAFARNAAADEEAAVEELAGLLYNGFRKEKERCRKEDPLALRFVITLFAVPSLLSLGIPAADKAADVFLAKWNADTPKTPLGKADYEKIQNGFKKKFCYITTATCRSLGAGDDCAELNEFRTFRDSWLSHTPDGAEKIAEYYFTAPFIVRAINASADANREYRRIWDEHLASCLTEIRSGCEAACARDYERMVRELEKKWLS